MKEKFEILKNIWSVPRYKALIELGLFFIFFLSIFIISKVPSNNEPVVYKSPLEVFRDKNNYQFQIKINDEIIEGNFLNDKINLNYNNINYTCENQIVEPTNFPYIDYLIYIDTNYIYNLIANEEIYSKTEFNDGTISKVYKLDNLEITTYELNSQIKKIEINDTNYSFEITYLKN